MNKSIRKQNMAFIWLAVLVGAFTLGYSAEYPVDVKKSSLEWLGRKVVGVHDGTVNLKSGAMKVVGKKISGEFVIDMTSIVVRDIKVEKFNKKLVSHLESDDFFDVANHKTAKFTITSMEPLGGGDDNNYRVEGRLSIKGITKTIVFPAEVHLSAKGFRAKANFTIDRTKWDIKYSSGSFFANLGDKAIDNNIEFTLNIFSKGYVPSQS